MKPDRSEPESVTSALRDHDEAFPPDRSDREALREAVAQAIFEHQFGDREWKREVAMAESAHPTTRLYSTVTTYRALADVAIDTVERFK